MIARYGLYLSLLVASVVSRPTSSIPVPIVIWHGLGDSHNSVPLLALQEDLRTNYADLKDVFVHIVRIEEDGSADSRATFFGNANDQVTKVCEQLEGLEEIVDPRLNPSGKFDAIGFSQGGQLLRAMIERCTSPTLSVRNLITLGSQHLGISSLPPCPPNSSPFSSCHLMQLSLVKSGLYSSFAQSNIVPAQYFRDEKRIEEYWEKNEFLRDINNERWGDEIVDGNGDEDEEEDNEPRQSEGREVVKRNATYKHNFASIENLVLLRREATVVPPHSAHFTLPQPNATNCLPLPNPIPHCYLTPLPLSDLPLYKYDYIGLKILDERGRIVKGVCDGVHMEIDQECWSGVVSWLGEGGGIVKRRLRTKEQAARLVLQL